MFTHVEKFNFPNLKRETYEGKRVYKTENGDRYPSVTTVLDTRQNLPLKWRKRVGAETANKISRRSLSVRGTKIHGLCEDYINNDELNTEKITFVEEIIFNNMKTYINRIDNIHCVEQFLFSEHLRLVDKLIVSLNLMVGCQSSISKHLQNSRRKVISKITLPSVQHTQSCLRKELVCLLTPLLLLLVLMGKIRNFLSKNVIITQNIC